jgi:hypothetical protein
MSTSPLDAALAGIESRMRKRIIARYLEMKRDFVSGNFDSCGMKAGKFCEAYIRYLQLRFDGTYTAFNRSLPRFDTLCKSFESKPGAAAPDGIRILAPRAMNYIYSMRNKRSFGHEGDDIDADKIDAVTVVRLVDWIVCETIRDFHSIPLEEAQEILDSLATREIPAIWEVMGRRRILATNLTYIEKTLLLLYQDTSTALLEEDLFEWVEHSHSTNFRRDVLKRLHGEKMIEYDQETKTAIISPLGVKRVEEDILPKAGTQ